MKAKRGHNNLISWATEPLIINVEITAEFIASKLLKLEFRTLMTICSKEVYSIIIKLTAGYSLCIPEFLEFLFSQIAQLRIMCFDRAEFELCEFI